MSPGGDERLLRALGCPARRVPEVLACCDDPYRRLGDAPPRLPLPDEPHVEAWRGYEREVAVSGAEALRRRLVQLRFPIAAGISRDPAYRAAVLRGAPPPPDGGVRFADPAGVRVTVHAGAAGAVPVVLARDRRDFVTLLRALAARNEPVPVPPAQGACMVCGLVNQDRVARHRERWAAAHGGGESAWQAELARLAARPELYQDRLLLLSTGPYSAVAAGRLGLDEDRWLADSTVIRREHELFHDLTFRLTGRLRSNPFDELLADAAGLLAAHGEYDPRIALRLLGIGRGGRPLVGARLTLYRGDPPLSPPAMRFVARLSTAAAANLRAAVAPGDAGDSVRRCGLLLAAASLGLPALAAPEGAERLTGRRRRFLQALSSAAPASGR